MNREVDRHVVGKILAASRNHWLFWSRLRTEGVASTPEAQAFEVYKSSSSASSCRLDLSGVVQTFFAP